MKHNVGPKPSLARHRIVAWRDRADVLDVLLNIPSRFTQDIE